MLSRVKSRPVENGSGVWNDNVICTKGAIVMEACFPSRTAEPYEESTGGAAVKIYAEREMAPSQFANRSDARSDLPQSLTASWIEQLFHIWIPVQQFTKPGFNDDRNTKVWSPRLQELKGGGQ
jgi:hypothetical protein